MRFRLVDRYAEPDEYILNWDIREIHKVDGSMSNGCAVYDQTFDMLTGGYDFELVRPEFYMVIELIR